MMMRCGNEEQKKETNIIDDQIVNRRKNIKWNGKKNTKVKRLRYAYGKMNHATWRGMRLQDKW